MNPDASPADDQRAPDAAQPPADLDEPTGLFLVDLGSLWRHGDVWRRYRFDLGGFLLAWLFVLFILAGTILLARIGS
jgi:hypothetical protein